MSKYICSKNHEKNTEIEKYLGQNNVLSAIINMPSV